VIFFQGGRRTPIQLVAYDSAGAPRIGAGRAIAGAREIVLDTSLARLHGLRVGDGVEILDRPLRVVGLSTGTDINFSPLAFVTYDELIDLYLEARVPGAMGGAPLLSFLLVELRPGADPASVRRALESGVEGVDVFTPAELSREDVNLGRRLFGPVVNLLVVVAWLAVILAVGLTMYAAVLDRRRDFGVMKALGVPTRALAATVVVETLLVVALGFPIALLIAKAAGAGIEGMSLYRVVPWAAPVVVRGAIAALLAALIGALIPVRRLAALEPDMVFRS
jgi:putative ABC transport system permease protein